MSDFLRQLLIKTTLLSVLFFGLSSITAFTSNQPLRIGIQKSLIPLEYIDSEGLPQGLIVDLWKLWSDKMQHPVIFIPLTERNIISALVTGEVDIINSNQNLPHENLKNLLQTNSLYKLDYFVFTHKDSKDLGELGDLKKYKIGVHENDFAKDWSKYGLPDSMIIRYPNASDLYRGLIKGEVQNGIASNTLFRVTLAKTIATLKINQSSEPMFSYPLYAWVDSDNAQLQKLVNSGLEKITAEEVQEIEIRWSGSSYGHQIHWELLSIGMLLLIILFIGIAMWFWNYNLKEKVNIATQDLQTQHQQIKSSENELSQLRNYLSNILDSMPSVLIGVNADVIITHWNQTAEQILGIPSVKALGKPLVKILPYMSPEIEGITESFKTGKIKKESKKPRLSDTGTHYDDVIIFPFLANGVKNAVIRIDDVTELVRMEELIIQNDKMLSVGGLAAGMAHEINNPLAGIIQTSGVLANRLGLKMNLQVNEEAARNAGTTIEVIQKYLENRDIPRMLNTINESGRRVSSIVDNMLSFARKGEGQKSSHSLVELINKTIKLAATDFNLKKQYDFKNIDIKMEITEKLPFIICEEAKIQQVFLNILSNGAHAMQDMGNENPCFIIRISFEKERKMVCLEIEDNGPGMNEEIRKRVFEPFFTTKPIGVGTGLGLSISYFIITKEHNGEMFVESALGEGTKFIIRLPVDS
jgi:PAS domain S-box-containing protein